MSAELGPYAMGFDNWRRIMAAVPDTSRVNIFNNAAVEAASFVSKGLDRATAADELFSMASAYGLDDMDMVQGIISRAFENVERVPDDIGIEEPQRLYTNGKETVIIPGLGEWNAGLDVGLPPPREWLLGPAQFCRQYISSIVAAGGTGKSALRLAQFISLTTGRELLRQKVFRRSRVLLISLEDDTNELQRRITACLMAYNEQFRITRADLDGWLFCATPKQLAKLAMYDEKKRRVLGTLEAQIRETLIRFDRMRLPIDLLSLDPFVKTHALEENSSGDMDYVCDLLAKMSVEFNIAVDSPHHVHKGTVEPGNADSGRGSSGIRDAARLVYTLCVMSEEEAGRFNVPLERRRFYVRLDPAKTNIAASPSKADWFELKGVSLGNGTPEYPNGDTVQVAVPWEPDTPFKDVPRETLNAILDALDAGLADGRRYSSAPRAIDRAAWPVVQQFLPAKGEQQCRLIILTWVDSGLLVAREYDNPIRKEKERGLYVDSTKRP